MLRVCTTFFKWKNKLNGDFNYNPINDYNNTDIQSMNTAYPCYKALKGKLAFWKSTIRSHTSASGTSECSYSRV